jgi:hypothetical protein
MSNTGRKNEPPKKAEEVGGSPIKRQPSPRADDDDDFEDGDMATPKRDRHGNDDEPL